MKSLPERSGAEFKRRLMPAPACAMPMANFRPVSGSAGKQRGVVLFFALIAMVIMALASVALIRSVDTSTMIAGNLAFRQAATSSGDAGINAAIVWLNAAQTAMDAAGNDVYQDAGCPAACTHTFNITDAAQGYYSNADATINLTDSAVWDAIDQSIVPEITDSSGNRIRYVIQRMCNAGNQRPSTGNCLYSSVVKDENEQGVKKYGEICNTSGCTPEGKSPVIRITARVTGPRNTVSYVQSFVY